MSFAFFAALGGLLVTLSTIAFLNSREAMRQSARVKVAARRRTAGFEG